MSLEIEGSRTSDVEARVRLTVEALAHHAAVHIRKAHDHILDLTGCRRKGTGRQAARAKSSHQQRSINVSHPTFDDCEWQELTFHFRFELLERHHPLYLVRRGRCCALHRCIVVLRRRRVVRSGMMHRSGGECAGGRESGLREEEARGGGTRRAQAHARPRGRSGQVGQHPGGSREGE
jgi:hypothetical protein